VALVTFAPATAAEASALADLRALDVVVHAARTWIPPSVIRLKRRVARDVERRWARGPRREPTTGDRRTQAVIDRLLAREPFDVIHAENVGVGTFRYPETMPKVLTEQEVGRHGSAASDDWKAIQPVIWKPFDRVQVFTPRDAALLRSVAPAFSDRVRVNPFGIDLPPAPDPAREDPESVVFVGSFNHAPNVDAAAWLAREIMPHVIARRPSVRLWLVGEDPPPSILRLAGPHLVVTGRVRDVAALLATAAVVVAPVRMGGGMRRKVLEALALGRAVVTTELGTEGLAGPPSELPVMLAGTAVEFGDCVLRLLASPSERRDLGGRGRAYVAAYHSWTGYADRLDAVYAEIRR
jgi:glycosyltransferase involved in cell wall biosynthesis